MADASVLVAVFIDESRSGDAVAEALRGRRLHAPRLLSFEVLHAARNLERRGLVTSVRAREGVQEALAAPVTLHAVDGLVDRIWELRANLTAYDASYVALAELIEAPLVTLDQRLARAPGLRCDVVVPG